METIAVQLTSRGMGAIAVVALAGENAAAIIQKLAGEKKTQTLKMGKAIRSALVDPETQAPLDDAVIVQVAEQQFEIHIHGGVAVVDTLLSALENAGAEKTSIDTASALGLFGNTLQAEIITTLPSAVTMTAARLVASQQSDGLYAWAARWHSWLDGKSPHELWRFHSASQWLVHRSAILAKLLHPARLAIIGPPNAGKSTLANALLGRPIAITSDTPGTTRDWIDALVTFTHNDIHVPILLIDTAGIRDTADPLEQISITRTHEQVAAADLILLLFDASREPTQEELHLIDTCGPSRLLIAANKTDAGSSALTKLRSRVPNVLPISAKTRTNLDALMSAALAKLDLGSISPTEPFAFTARQQLLLHELARTTAPAAAQSLLTALAP